MLRMLAAPQEAGKLIADCCDASLLDADKISRAMQVQEHALTPVLDDLGRVIREHVAAKQAQEQKAHPGFKPAMTPDEIAGYLHWGATTQNITQTGFVLNLRRAHSLILSSVSKFVAVIGRLCKDKADLVMPGRTHGQQALPITFGYKCAAWLDELLRHAERLAQSADRLFRAILGGGAGTYASFGERGPQVASIYARRLGLKAMVVPFRNSVDHFSEYVMVLALLGTTCGKMAREIRELGKDEIGEVSEPVHDGGVGSSTMPQKVNPKLCMGIIVLETKLRSLPAVALEAMLGDHEADGARTAMVGEACVDAVRNTSRILDLCTALFGGMRFFPMRMMQNFQHSDGMITSERLMLELGRRGMGRDHAHHLVHQLCVAHGRRLRAFREEVRLHLIAPPGSDDAAQRKVKSFGDLQGLRGSPSPSKGESPANGQSPTDPIQAGSPSREGTPAALSFKPPSTSLGVSVRASAEGLPIPRTPGTPNRYKAKTKRSSQRRLSIDSIAQGGGGDYENGPTHPGSLAVLASEEPDIVKYLGNGDAAAAQLAAENLLNPKNYTGECSKIAITGAKRARRATSALADLAVRYHSISELVFHGRAEAGNADKISVIIAQLTERADAFEAISAADELKEVPSFAPTGQISLPSDERVSSLNLVAAEANIAARQRRLAEGSPSSPNVPDPGATTPGPPV
jgi:3-carboxy-cis,cis-muconate cycloisomerase